MTDNQRMADNPHTAMARKPPAGEFDGLSFRRISRDDLPTLYRWMQRPHVAQWWSSPATLAEVHEDFLPSIEGTTTTKAYIASLNQEDIGFIQAYVVAGSGDGWWETETDPGARGIDQFIAHADRLNQGLGTAMISNFVARLLEDPTVTKVQADPNPDNHRAIRCYTKAGFLPVGRIVTPDGPALLMRYHRSEPHPTR